MPYITHPAMRTLILSKMKVISNIRLMGLDIGRKSIGVALSDESITNAFPYKTFILDPQISAQNYSFGRHKEFYQTIKALLSLKKIKGIVVAFPLDLNNKETPHCKFVRKMTKHMMTEEEIAIPFTLVKENESTKSDSRAIIELLSGKEPELVGVEKIASKTLKKYIGYLHSNELIMK